MNATTGVGTHLVKYGTVLNIFCENASASAESFGVAKDTVGKYEEPELEAFLRDKALELAAIEVQAQALRDSIARVGAKYTDAVPGARAKFDFVKVIDAQYKEAHDAHPAKEDLKQTICWNAYLEGAGEDAEDIVDDDEMQVAGGEFKNIKCVLSQKGIFELADPVEDANKWIWERAVIEEYIQQRGGRCQNPAAAAGVIITLAELKPARKVMREKFKASQRQTATREEGFEVL